MWNHDSPGGARREWLRNLSDRGLKLIRTGWILAPLPDRFLWQRIRPGRGATALEAIGVRMTFRGRWRIACTQRRPRPTPDETTTDCSNPGDGPEVDQGDFGIPAAAWFEPTPDAHPKKRFRKHGLIAPHSGNQNSVGQLPGWWTTHVDHQQHQQGENHPRQNSTHNRCS